MRTLVLMIALAACFFLGITLSSVAAWSLQESHPGFRGAGILGALGTLAKRTAQSAAGQDISADQDPGGFPTPDGLSATITDGEAKVGRPYRVAILLRMGTKGHSLDELSVPTSFLSNFEGIMLDPRDGEPSDADGMRSFPLNRQFLTGEIFTLKLFLVPKKAGEFTTEMELWCNEYEAMLTIPIRVTVAP